jgi:hypothetical protein
MAPLSTSFKPAFRLTSLHSSSNLFSIFSGELNIFSRVLTTSSPLTKCNLHTTERLAGGDNIDSMPEEPVKFGKNSSASAKNMREICEDMATLPADAHTKSKFSINNYSLPVGTTRTTNFSAIRANSGRCRGCCLLYNGLVHYQDRWKRSEDERVELTWLARKRGQRIRVDLVLGGRDELQKYLTTLVFFSKSGKCAHCPLFKTHLVL